MTFTLLRISSLLTLVFSFTYANCLLENIRKEPLLTNGFVGFITYKKQKYLISVGISPIKNKSIQSKVKAIKEARTLSQFKLNKFINSVNIKTKETLTTINRQESYSESIIEKSSGILKNMIDIGKWKKENEYFYVSGILIEE